MDNELYSEYRERYLKSPELNLQVPVDISLELSSLCNHHCTYCYHADKKNLPFQQRLMTPKIFKEIVGQAAEIGRAHV